MKTINRGNYMTYQANVDNSPENTEEGGTKDEIMSDTHLEMTIGRECRFCISWHLWVFSTHLFKKYIINYPLEKLNLNS